MPIGRSQENIQKMVATPLNETPCILLGYLILIVPRYTG